MSGDGSPRISGPEAAGSAPPASSARRQADPGPAQTTSRLHWSALDWTLLGLVLLVAVGVRVGYIEQLRTAPDFSRPVVDAEFYDAWARAFARGEPFENGPYYRAPLYAWFLGVTYFLSSGSFFVARVAQAALGALTCGMIYLIGRLCFSRIVALIAGLGSATYWILIYYGAELLMPALITFLDVAMVLCLLLAGRDRSRVWPWALAGIALGLSAITRPDVLLFAPFAVLWLAWEGRRNFRATLLRASLFTACCLLPILPVTVRNGVVGGDWVLISSQGGVNLYIGNNPQADGFNVILPGTRPHWHDTYIDSIAIAERAEGRPLKPSEVSRYYTRETLKFFREQPAAAASLLWSKFRHFWSGYEFANNKDIYDYTERYTPIVKYLPLSFGIIAPVGLLGLAVCWPRRSELFPLWGFLLAHMAAVVMFFVSARFRVPILPALLLFAAVGVDWLARSLLRRRWGVALQGAIVIGLAWLVVHSGLDKVSQPGSWDLTVAAMDLEKGRWTDAEAAYRTAIAKDPRSAAAQHGLALALTQQGRVNEAMECVSAAIALNPDMAEAHDTLGALLGNLGRIDEAIASFRRATELLPHYAPAHQHLGEAWLRKNNVDAAAPSIQRAYELAPERPDTLATMGFLAAQRGTLGEAIDFYERSLAIAPDNPRVLLALATAQAARGQTAQARDALARALPLAQRAAAGPLVAEIRRLAAELERRGRPASSPTSP